MFKPIDTITPARLRELMNSHGIARRPFVWGLDYESRRGFFLDAPYEHGPILWQMGDAGNCQGLCPTVEEKPVLKIVAAPSDDDYARMFDRVIAGLMRGDSFLTNLTARTRVECNVGLRDIFLHSKAPFRLLLGDEFVCFSPEPFVRIENGVISTYPMKGTIDASVPGAADVLMGNHKELCEHYTIVDLMRNDLNRVAEDVRVARFRYIDRIATRSRAILQTSSEICGRLADGDAWRFGDIVLPLLPAGSITGAPKDATVGLIGGAETSSRGWYTGVFGHFDGRCMQSAVMIRCVQRDPDDGQLYFHSGGGITVNSDCCEEYAELVTKIYLT